MNRGGWFGILLFLLVLPAVSATLTMNCPSSAQATHPFTISASDSSASSIKLLYLGQWHEYTGNAASATFSEPIDSEHLTQKYRAESYDSSGSLLDSTYCNVYIDSANFPCSSSVSPSVKTVSIGQPFWATVSASDADRLRRIGLGSYSASCYNGGYPTTCDTYFQVSFPTAGTYTLTTNAQDYWYNPCETPATLTVTVTDPCAGSTCGDCADSSTDCTTYSGGSLCNPQDPNTCYNPDQYCTKTYASSNTPCTTDGGKLGTCDGQGTCVANCQSAPETCNGLDDDCDGVVDNHLTDCPGFCVGGSCVGCVGDGDCPADGWNTTTVTRWAPLDACNEQEQQRRDFLDYSCSSNACVHAVTAQDWVNTANTRAANDDATCSRADGGTGWCANGACVQCRNSQDCGPGETCQVGSCAAPQECQQPSDCTANPYDPDCSSVACDNNQCVYNPANEDASCDDGLGRVPALRCMLSARS